MPVAYCYYVPWCSACGQPSSACCCGEDLALDVPQELTVDGSAESANAEVVIGGSDDVEPVLETLPAPGAVNPEVTLEQVDTGVTTLYHALPIPAGYTVKDDLPDVSPGTRLRLTANGCFARLRWCERIEY
jgi:hypothetical protein